MRLLTKLHILILFCLLSANVSAEREAKSPQETELVEAVSNNFVTLAERLISENVAVDITDSYGQSLLMFAAKNNNEGLVKLLIERGADPNYVINEKLSYNENRSAIRALLLNKLTVLDYAVKSNSVAMVDLLIELGATLDLTKKGLDSAVAKASMANNVKMVRYLLSKGSKVSDDTGIALIYWHIKNTADPFGTIRITQNTDFSLVKIWDDYGIPLDSASLTSSRMITNRDKRNIIGYLKAYNSWVEDGAKLSQKIIHKQGAEPISRAENEARLDSIMVAAKFRAENYTPSVTGREELATRQDKIKNWTIILFVIILVAIGIYQRKPIVALWKVYFKKQNIPPPFSPTQNSIPRPNVRPVHKPIENNAQNKKVSKNGRNKKYIPITAKGWREDDTINIEVNYLTIEDMINPIRMRNEHERAVREMIWYIRRLEKMSEEEIADSLGPKGLQPKLEKLRISIDSTNVRDVYKRSLYVLVEHYSQRDKQVQIFLRKTKWGK